MCGIAGFVGAGTADLLGRMTAVIAHRGPDDRGESFFEGPPSVGLGNTRLAIQDLSPSGHQPMTSESGRFTIVFNGEIYNFKQLRQRLIEGGHRFHSDSDTEVVLRLFEQQGARMLSSLNGMFAIAIWDARDQTLFLARDRFGEKPLYLYQSGATLLFGSEIKSFRCHPAFTAELDREALLSYLTFLWVPEPNSLFAGVRKLPPGHFAKVQNGAVEVERYWDLPLNRQVEGSREEIAANVHDFLVRSVESRLVSDRPVGAFLSGGIDSSTIAAAMAEVSSDPISTYTVGFRKEDFKFESIESEVPLAKEVAKRLGAKWQYIELDSRVTDLLPHVIHHLDEPVADPAAITSFLLCQAAKRERTVLLSGMGGDEVFAGYRRHKALKLTAAFNRLPFRVRQKLLPSIVDAFSGTTNGWLLGLVRDARVFMRDAASPFEARFVGYARYYSDEELDNLMSDEMRAVRARTDVEASHKAAMRNTEGAEEMLRMLYTDMKTFMPSLNMLYMDKMSMASAVEVRLPFLDHNLVEYASGIPADLKIRGLTVKWILRKAFEGRVPNAVLWNRKKVGFGAPVRTWLTRDLKPLLNEVLSEKRLRERGFFKPSVVRAIVDRPLEGRNDFRIWAFLSLEIWLEGTLGAGVSVERRCGSQGT